MVDEDAMSSWNTHDCVAALRQISKGLDALAHALTGDEPELTLRQREHAALREWGDRGLARAEASALLRKYGFAPQTLGGWARGNWIELRDDDLRYITDQARHALTEAAAIDSSRSPQRSIGTDAADRGSDPPATSKQ